MMGYAHGSDLMKTERGETEYNYRYGPVLQRGFISALAPFDQAEIVTRVLLDIRSATFMSGSPVFDPTSGTVLGLHNAGHDHAVSFAIPLDADRLALFRNIAQEGTLGTSGSTALPPVAMKPSVDG